MFVAAVGWVVAPSWAVDRLSMEEAVTLAWEASRELHAKRAAVDMAEGRAQQAGAWSNPVVEVSAEDVPASPMDLSRGKHVVELEQAVSLGGKIGWRERTALIQLSLAEAEYQVARRAVHWEVRDRFVQVLAAQERRSVAEADATLAQEMATLVKSLVQAGAVSAVELTKAEVEAAKSQGEWEESQAEFHLAEAGLKAAMGRLTLTVDRYEGTLVDEVSWPSLEIARARLADHPAVRVKHLASAAAEAGVESARAESWPDLHVKFGVGRGDEHRGPIVQGGIAFPFPVFDRQHGGVREAEAAVRGAGAERERAVLEMERAWLEVTARVGHALKQVKRYRQTVLPGAERVLSATREGYQRGKFRYVEVLEAQRALAAARRVAIEAVETVNRGRWQLVELMGEHQVGSGGETP